MAKKTGGRRMKIEVGNLTLSISLEEGVLLRPKGSRGGRRVGWGELLALCRRPTERNRCADCGGVMPKRSKAIRCLPCTLQGPGGGH